MLALVRNFRTDEVADGFREKPELVQCRDDRGRNWLHLCSSVDVRRHPALNKQDSVRLAAVLLEAGIDVNAPAFAEGSWQATPLWYAVARGRNHPLARFLLESGSSPEHCLWAAAFNEDLEMLKLLVDSGAPLEAIAEHETPFLGAVKYSKFKAAEFLLEVGSNPDFQDVKRMTALHYMLKKNSAKKHFEMFVRYGARGDIADADGNTATALMMRKRDPFFYKVAAKLLQTART